MPSSFFMPSLDMESLDMESFDIESLDMPSLAIVSFFMPSLDIVSFFMPSLDMSSAKAAGASARLNDRAAAEIPSARRVRIVMVCIPFEKCLLERRVPHWVSTLAELSLLLWRDIFFLSRGFQCLLRGSNLRRRHFRPW